jgi:PRC-barrel domain
MPMSDHLKRHALAAVILLALAAPPLQAQTSALLPAAAATNPVRVADLLDLPIVDESKSTMGRVRGVVRTDDGKVQLLLPLGGLFGFGERLVPIPMENVALSGPQVMVLEVPPDRFQKSATWYGSKSVMLAPAETITINRR